MPKVLQVRDLPDEVHEVLRVRAARSGLSLAKYVRQELSRWARQPTPAEFLARLDSRDDVSVSGEDVVEAVRQERDRG